MQTLFLKYFPAIIVLHFVLCVFTFMAVFSYIDKVALVGSGWGELKPLMIKSVILALVNQVIPFVIYWKARNPKEA